MKTQRVFAEDLKVNDILFMGGLQHRIVKTESDSLNTPLRHDTVRFTFSDNRKSTFGRNAKVTQVTENE